MLAAEYRPAWIATLFFLIATAAGGDEFDRLEGESLGRVPGGLGTREVRGLSQEELGRLPRVLVGVRSTVLVARTDQGNLARLLISLARRTGEAGREVPVLVVERFATFAPTAYRQRVARGQDALLFDGSRLDLDSGQFVPEGFGGDLVVRVGDEGSIRIEAAEGVTLYTLTEPLLENGVAPGRPSPARAVLAGDHAGRFRLVVGGRWSGSLELRVDGGGEVDGSFRSDQTGAVYRLRGEIVRGGTPRLEATIDFPRSRMTIAGYLWADGKDALAGTARLMEQEYGFIAVREGRSLEPPGLEIGSAGDGDAVVLQLAADGTIRREGVVVEAAGLSAELGADATRLIRVVVSPGVGFEKVERLVDELRLAGLVEVRVGTVAPEGMSDE